MKFLKSVFREITIKSCLLSVAGGVILAFGLYNIHSVADITEGGTLGLTLLFEHWFNISPAVSEIMLNALCYLIGIKFLGRTFLIYSAVSTLSFSAFYRIAECFPRIYPEIADYPVLCAVLGAVFVGIGVGLSVRTGGAPCGDDALAMTVSKLSKIKIQWVYLISDITVLSLSLTYIEPKRIIWSLITVVISGQIIGFIAKPKKS